MKGKMKETTGKAKGDMAMEREGRNEQMSGRAEEVVDKTSEPVKRTGR